MVMNTSRCNKINATEGTLGEQTNRFCKIFNNQSTGMNGNGQHFTSGNKLGIFISLSILSSFDKAGVHSS